MYYFYKIHYVKIVKSYLVLITVIGIRRAPLMVRAATPKATACKGVGSLPFSFTSVCDFNQCNDEKYRPTPGTHHVMD